MAKKQSIYIPQTWETKGNTKRWTRLFDDMITSPAFISLTPDAKILYFYLKREYKGVYNEMKDTVIVPYNQITELTGIRKGNIKKTIDELEQFGFIIINQTGGLYRVTNHYTLIKEWRDIEKEAAELIKKDIKISKRNIGKIPEGLPGG